MYVAHLTYDTRNLDYFFSNADSALQFVRHIVNKEEAYYACGEPLNIKLYRVLPIDSIAQCANAIDKAMWNDPDYFYTPLDSEPLASWQISKND